VVKATAEILVIEDGRVDFETVRAVLSVSMRVYQATTLGAGIGMVEEVQPDCVLLDLGLPDSEGVETLERLLRASPDLPVVVLTGRDDEGLGSTLVQAGAQDYLAKGDVRPSVLLRTIRHAIERSRIHKALMDARAQLVRAQRLDAFGQLASGMAHDFNNLLAVISTTAGLASQRSELDPDLMEELSDILAATDRGRRLVSQLLTFARRRPGKPKRVGLGTQVHALHRILMRTLNADVSLSLETPQEGPFVRIDPGLLDQVLLNLVVNARDAMPNGGCIQITASCVDESVARIEVADTGSGMTREQARRAVEPFYTTKPQGNGLGLAMCYGIIEQAAGQLRLDSILGTGTTVVIDLPIVRSADRVTPSPSPRELPLLAGLRVLLVEDLPSLRRLLRRVLQQAGVTVVEAGDGKVAMEMLSTDSDFDLVVSDVSLPLISGPELADLLQSYQPALPVVLMSGRGVPPEHELSKNVRDVLEKPFKPAVLLDAIARAKAGASG
jgi:signal transduction histidine kinase